MTLLDTSVAIDLQSPGSPRYADAFRCVRAAVASGGVVIDHVILAELHASPDPERTVRWLASWDFAIVPLTDAVSRRAGEARRLYIVRGGDRTAIIADFLIGAHAAVLGIPLITRDRQRFASYFPELTIIAPETDP